MTTTEQESAARFEILTQEECLEHLGFGSYVGRVGFVRDGRPQILPVNYLFDHDSIVFRTPAEGVLATLDGEQVAFEVDTSRPFDHAGWSVMVQGAVKAVTDDEEVAALQRGPLRSWAWMVADSWFRISIDAVSGRRIVKH